MKALNDTQRGELIHYCSFTCRYEILRQEDKNQKNTYQQIYLNNSCSGCNPRKDTHKNVLTDLENLATPRNATKSLAHNIQRDKL